MTSEKSRKWKETKPLKNFYSKRCRIRLRMKNKRRTECGKNSCNQIDEDSLNWK